MFMSEYQMKQAGAVNNKYLELKSNGPGLIDNKTIHKMKIKSCDFYDMVGNNLGSLRIGKI